MKIETKAKKLQERIQREIEKSCSLGIKSSFNINKESVQKELRLRAYWHIDYTIDSIHYPKNLEGLSHPLWNQMYDITRKLRKLSILDEFDSGMNTFPINEKTKTGPQKRAEAKAAFIIEYGTQFLDKLKKFSTKTHLKSLQRDISVLQSQQKEIIPQMRKVNSEFITKRKQAKAEKQAEEQKALTEGRFWDASKETLKDYFHPPFSKNYLADVSEKWRAALFTECESESYKRWDKTWGHKLVGTGRGYLCGIDDNGEEWGHEIQNLYQNYDQYGNVSLDSSVEDAMSELFKIPENKLWDCYRQGDLLFCEETIPESHKQELEEVDEWEVRESHTLKSKTLKHNRTYFQAEDDINVVHTSHASITLPAGEYRLYALQVENAD